MRLEHLHARTIRRKSAAEVYCQVLPEQTLHFAPDEVLHIRMYAPESSIYGLPEYLGALNSLLLNEQATLFRRRFYVNGAHMGFILFTQGQDWSEEATQALAEKMSAMKGVGNFRSLYLHLGGEGKVELLPVGDFAKDDFEHVKTLSRDDIISAHRVPPQILAMLTDRVSNTGDLAKVVDLYNANVVLPIQIDFMSEINHNIRKGTQIDFDPYLPWRENTT